MESIRLSIILLLLPQVLIRSYSALYRTIKYGSAMQYAPHNLFSVLCPGSTQQPTLISGHNDHRPPVRGHQAKRKVEVRRFKASEVPSPER